MKFTQKDLEKTIEIGEFYDPLTPGLFLRVRPQGKSWMYKRMINRQRKCVGLGGFEKVSLVKARVCASKLRAMSDEEFLNYDPKAISAKKRGKVRETFEYIASLYEQWNLDVGNWQEWDKGHRVYLSRMKCHIHPVLDGKIFSEITVEDIALVAQGCWDKPDIVDRCLQILRKLFDWARAKGYTTHDNPANRQGSLKFLLPNKKHVAKNRGALSVEELPHFMKSLHDQLGESNARRCAFFAILTATRSATAREAKWSQIDFENKEWTIPPSQLKVSENGGLVVPLADEVIRFLRTLKQTEGNDLIFPNHKGKVMSDGMFSNIIAKMEGDWVDKEQTLRREETVRATVHGIARATFRTWSQDDALGNDKKFDARIAELCLHHKIPDAYNGAYERNQSFIRRREMMNDWAKYCYSLIESP